MALPLGDESIRFMINTALRQLHEAGTIDTMLTKYNLPNDIAFRIKRNYIVPE